MIMEEENVTRAARKPSASAAKKPAASTAKKKTAKKKTGTTTRKTGTSLKLSAAEKKMVTNYRKCNSLEKELISALCEKCAGGTAVKDMLSLLQNLIK